MKYIELTQGRKASVDDQFYDELNQYSWSLQPTGRNIYARRVIRGIGGKQKQIKMHHDVLRLAGVERGQETDHIDGDGLNNTLANLRAATKSQNQHNRRLQKNSSGIKGVSLHKMTGRWQANIQVGGKQRYLGLFDTREEAGKAYAAAAKELHREFARIA